MIVREVKGKGWNGSSHHVYACTPMIVLSRALQAAKGRLPASRGRTDRETFRIVARVVLTRPNEPPLFASIMTEWNFINQSKSNFFTYTDVL